MFKNLKEARKEGGLVNIHEIKSLLNLSGRDIRKIIKNDDSFPYVKVGRYYMFSKDQVAEYAREKGL